MENNSNTGELSLEERLKQATENKTPGTTVTPTLKPAAENTSAASAQTKSGKLWNNPDDFDEPTPSAEPNKQDTEIKITAKSQRAGARTAVAMWDTTQRAVFTPLVNLKYKRKLQKLDIEKLEKVAYVTKNTLTGDDYALRDRFDKLMDARDRKLNRVPMTDTEKGDMEEMWFNYFVATNTTLSPAWGLVMSMGASMGKRVTELATD